MRLQGTFTALITPFQKNEELDFPALENLVRHQVQGKVEGLVPCGTTGESPTLTHKEHSEVIAFVIQKAKELNPDIKIIAGTGSNSTREAVSLANSAEQDGADYQLSVSPYYNKPTQEGLYRHFSTIADSSKLPIILYNIPGRTNVRMEIATIARLARHENIIGIKEATGDINFMTQVILETPEDFSVLSGDDNMLLPLLSVGGDGVISVISNVFPQELGDITRLYLSGKTEEARKAFLHIFPLCQAMFTETNPIPVKFAANYMSLCENVLRLPMTPLSKEKENSVIGAIQKFQEKSEGK